MRISDLRAHIISTLSEATEAILSQMPNDISGALRSFSEESGIGLPQALCAIHWAANAALGNSYVSYKTQSGGVEIKEPGYSALFVGDSSCGKSFLTKLLQGAFSDFYDSDEYMAGIRLREADLKARRSQVKAEAAKVGAKEAGVPIERYTKELQAELDAIESELKTVRLKPYIGMATFEAIFAVAEVHRDIVCIVDEFSALRTSMRHGSTGGVAYGGFAALFANQAGAKRLTKGGGEETVRDPNVSVLTNTTVEDFLAQRDVDVLRLINRFAIIYFSPEDTRRALANGAKSNTAEKAFEPIRKKITELIRKYKNRKDPVHLGEFPSHAIDALNEALLFFHEEKNFPVELHAPLRDFMGKFRGLFRRCLPAYVALGAKDPVYCTQLHGLLLYYMYLFLHVDIQFVRGDVSADRYAQRFLRELYESEKDTFTFPELYAIFCRHLSVSRKTVQRRLSELVSLGVLFRGGKNKYKVDRESLKSVLFGEAQKTSDAKYNFWEELLRGVPAYTHPPANPDTPGSGAVSHAKETSPQKSPVNGTAPAPAPVAVAEGELDGEVSPAVIAAYEALGKAQSKYIFVHELAGANPGLLLGLFRYMRGLGLPLRKLVDVAKPAFEDAVSQMPEKDKLLSEFAEFAKNPVS